MFSTPKLAGFGSALQRISDSFEVAVRRGLNGMAESLNTPAYDSAVEHPDLDPRVQVFSLHEGRPVVIETPLPRSDKP